jgi:hypothetical protein
MSTILYTDTGRVAQALAFQSPETLNGAVAVGATSITLNTTIPADWTIGSTLILDVNNPTLRETVTISAISGNTLTVSAVKNAHVTGSPVVNGTIVSNYVSPASRWFDTATFNKNGFGYETVTDTKTAYIDNYGIITVPLSKPTVDIDNVVSATFRSTVWDTPDTLDLTKAWIEDKYFLKIASANCYTKRTGMAVVTYSGGYNPIPDDITQAVTVMAARFYKERDSGYSDVIGSPETGIMQYQKAAPADVWIVIDKYTRVTE